MAQTPNRNAQRSIRLIEESFLALLMEEPYEKITVTQITARADLNRSTFYAHFTDVDDLARTVSDELADQIMSVIGPMLKDDFYRDPQPLLDQIGSVVSKRRPLFVRLASIGTLDGFFTTLLAKMRDQVRRELVAHNPEHATEALVDCDFLAAGMLWACRSWIVGDFGDLEISEVTSRLAQLAQATSAVWQ